MLRRLRETMGKIADELLERSRQVKDGKEDTIIADKSIIGILGTCLLTHVFIFFLLRLSTSMFSQVRERRNTASNDIR